MYRFVLSLLVIVLPLVSRTVAAETRPNIVFVYTDDQAPTAVGMVGDSQFKTPHMDSLFHDGVRLANAFVTTPVCSPSRAGLMTSRYSSELAILDWINPSRETEHGLDPDTVTWPELLAAAGYKTGLVGKWHLGTADRYHPTRTGYDYFIGFRAGGASPVDPKLEKDGVSRPFKGFTPDILTDHAIEFVRQNCQQPFLLSLHFRAPHARWLPVRDEDWLPYKELDPQIPNPNFVDLDVRRVKRMTREYMASVASVDRNLGRLLETLDELGLRENTIVIFTSDHGYHLGHHGLWYKGNAQWQLTKLPPQKWPGIAPKQRPNLLDQAIRVPCAVRWPKQIKAGTVVGETVSNLDWFPTLLAMAGIDLPTTVRIRGHNFLPLLRGEKIEWDNRLYCEYSMRHGATTDMRAARTPDWKLMIDFHNVGREELYDLRNDPGETRDLSSSTAAEHLAIKAQLAARIRSVMRELEDPAQNLKTNTEKARDP
ncbi:MAG TPA: sulfatase-like hydrolase/transferase [Pirellulaceae bacterium]|nr:sulfatase-like hydrolase/transferase [Pirellulaceae bacterium]